ncbi:45440_t:CDS:1, partial [Gigaspora margarita]
TIPETVLARPPKLNKLEKILNSRRAFILRYLDIILLVHMNSPYQQVFDNRTSEEGIPGMQKVVIGEKLRKVQGPLLVFEMYG